MLVTFNELFSNIFFKVVFSPFLTWVNKNIYFHKHETLFLLWKRKYESNSFTINKFMMLKYLFYITIHQLYSNNFHVLLFIIIVHINHIINYIYRIGFIYKLVKFNTLYKNIDMFHTGKCGSPSQTESFLDDSKCGNLTNGLFLRRIWYCHFLRLLVVCNRY